MPEILPDVFLWVQLWAVSGQSQKADIVRGLERFCGVPPGPVDDDDSVCALLNLAADFDEVSVHGMGVGARHDQSGPHAARRTDGPEDIGALITLIAHGARACAFFAPDIGERPFLAYAGFILNPDFEALSGGMSGEDFGDFGREVFLKAA